MDVNNQKKLTFYWVSLLIQDNEHSEPWLAAMTDSCISMKEAMDDVNKGRENYRVLSAWIDTFDEDNKKTTVFHECYVDAIGKVHEPESLLIKSQVLFEEI